MNYFELHLGDYAEATAHLSILEDGVYMRLVRKYYATESALPGDLSEIKRLVGAKQTSEKHAVERVVSEFFYVGEDGLYHNRRCDEELAKFLLKSQKARDSATARWGSGRNANASNGAMRTHSERIANAMPTQCEGNAPNLQSPVTSNQTPNKTGGGEKPRAARSAAPTQLGIEFELTPERREYAQTLGLEAKRSFELFVNHFVAADGPKSFSRNWDARWRKWCLEDSQKATTPRKTRFEQAMEQIDGD